MSQQFTGTRKAGVLALERFAPAMGWRYANGRNHDQGPGNRTDVSLLSPYIRRRLVTEHEAVAAALSAHGSEASERFVQEVFWRSYFKGWLERRPQVWDRFVRARLTDLQALECDPQLSGAVAQAEAGQTGLECFDAWAGELVDTGYLHNHARMWFASIWIFTLGLPWRLGADFFYRHLLDGDAASNTLGWRWVAGLHTRGKPYHAQAWNIAKFTNHRFTPRHSDLAEPAGGLEAQEPDGLPPVLPLRAIAAPQAGIPTALLITDEDCRIEDFDRAQLDIRTAATLSAGHLRTPRAVSGAVIRFEAEALADAAARAGVDAVPLRADDPGALAQWAHQAGARQIVTPYVPRGPLHDWLTRAAPEMAAQGIALCEWRRDWDSAIWPHATAGFFKVRKKIPQILSQVMPV